MTCIHLTYAKYIKSILDINFKNRIFSIIHYLFKNNFVAILIYYNLRRNKF